MLYWNKTKLPDGSCLDNILRACMTYMDYSSAFCLTWGWSCITVSTSIYKKCVLILPCHCMYWIDSIGLGCFTEHSVHLHSAAESSSRHLPVNKCYPFYLVVGARDLCQVSRWRLYFGLYVLWSIAAGKKKKKNCRAGGISEIHYDLGRLFANIQSRLMHINIPRAFFSSFFPVFFFCWSNFNFK